MAEEVRTMDGETELEQLLRCGDEDLPEVVNLLDFFGEDTSSSIDELKKLGMGLTPKELEDLAKLLDANDEKSTRATAKLREASKSAGAALKKTLRAALRLSDKLQAMEKASKEGELRQMRKMVPLAVRLMTTLTKALEAFGTEYEAEREVSKAIAGDADKFKQELSTVSRWAFCSKSESAKRAKAPKQGVKSEGGDNTVQPEGGDNTVQPEGGDNTVQPEGGDNTVQSEGGDNTVQPEGGDNTVRSEGGDSVNQGKNGNKQTNQSGSGLPVPQPEEVLQRTRTTLAQMVQDGKLKIIKTVDHMLSDEDFICKICGSRMTKNGFDHAYYTLVMQPVKFGVIEHRVQTAVCNHCPEVNGDGKRTVAKAHVPDDKLASRSYLSPSLAAFIATMWVYFGVPKYRLQIMTAMMGFPMNSSVMGNMLSHLETWLLPIYELLKMEARGVPVLFVDETTWRNMQHLKSKERRDSRVFAYVTDPNGGKPIRIYEYQPDRKAEHITDFLEGYHYIVVTDGYQGYEKVKDIIHCICWAHYSRRYVIRGDFSKAMGHVGFWLSSRIIFSLRRLL